MFVTNPLSSCLSDTESTYIVYLDVVVALRGTRGRVGCLRHICIGHLDVRVLLGLSPAKITMAKATLAKDYSPTGEAADSGTRSPAQAYTN